MSAVRLLTIRDLILGILFWNSSAAVISAGLQKGALTDAFDDLTSELPMLKEGLSRARL